MMTRKGLDGGSLKLLTDDSVLKIHQTAMQVIEEVGFEVQSEMALELFEGAGARVDWEKHLVRLNKDKVEELIKTAPSEIRLCGQDVANDILLGARRVYAGTGGTALYIYDPVINQKRQANLEDLRCIAKLVDKLDNIHFFLLPTYPNELPLEHVDVNRFFAGLDNTAKHVMGGVYTLDGAEQVIRTAQIVAGSAENLRQRPLISMIACIISPLRIDKTYGDMLVTIARNGIPVACPAEPLCGATAPVTLAGTLVVQTVDTLLGVLLTQIANPGTPVLFGSVATNTDLRNLNYLAGSVEMGLLNAAGAQMAQFYRLPFYATGGMTDSKTLDAQSGYESALTNLLCALSGANFIHDAAGLMEFAMTASYEKYVIDNEILGMVMRAVEGIKVDDDTMAFDLIKQTGPGGNFVAARHTRHFMRSEHYQPSLSDRNSQEEWLSKGGKETWERASEIVKELLAKPKHSLPTPIKQEVISRIKGIIA
ncbi:MAG: trimethylamine methyltransferase family protein [Chloroflexota bacterium]|nr:MAG: trimethylamine methyltransferase family protein [Chloroflexota bacterium]